MNVLKEVRSILGVEEDILTPEEKQAIRRQVKHDWKPITRQIRLDAVRWEIKRILAHAGGFNFYENANKHDEAYSYCMYQIIKRMQRENQNTV